MKGSILKSKGDLQLVEFTNSNGSTYVIQRPKTIDSYSKLKEAKDMMKDLLRQDNIRPPNYVCHDRFDSYLCDDRVSDDRMAGRF